MKLLGSGTGHYATHTGKTKPRRHARPEKPKRLRHSYRKKQNHDATHGQRNLLDYATHCGKTISLPWDRFRKKEKYYRVSARGRTKYPVEGWVQGVAPSGRDRASHRVRSHGQRIVVAGVGVRGRAEGGAEPHSVCASHLGRGIGPPCPRSPGSAIPGCWCCCFGTGT